MAGTWQEKKIFAKIGQEILANKMLHSTVGHKKKEIKKK